MPKTKPQPQVMCFRVFNKTIKKTVELCSFLEASFHLRRRRKMKHHELNSVMINIKIKKSVSFHTS